ncbi:MAG: hypothetical protein ACXVCP_02180 [Bdellovibrio sp.]
MLKHRLLTTFSLGIVLAFFIAAKVSASEEWYKCQSSNQCVVVKGNCDVQWAANKKFAKQSRKKPPRVDGPCTKPLEIHPADTVAFCLANQCALHPPGRYAGGNSIDPENCHLSRCWGALRCNYLTCTRKDGSQYSKLVL